MGFRLKTNKAEEKRIELKEGENTGFILYSSQRITPRVMKEIRNAKDDLDAVFLLAEFIANVVIEWDLIDEQGNDISITANSLEEQSIGFLWNVFSLIQGDARMGEAQGGSSSGGSSRKGSTGTRRKNTRS